MSRISTEHALATLRASGRKVTPQRAAVIRALEQADGHPTAEEIHARIAGTVPGLALKTVYAVLHDLASLHLIEPLTLPHSPTRWEPNTAPHAHFLCDGCGRLVDIPVDPTVLMPLVQRAGRSLRMRRPSLLVHGQCDRCLGPTMKGNAAGDHPPGAPGLGGHLRNP